jgi:hypothetical protein
MTGKLEKAEHDYNLYLDLLYGNHNVSSDEEYAEIVLNGEKAYKYLLDSHEAEYFPWHVGYYRKPRKEIK